MFIPAHLNYLIEGTCILPFLLEDFVLSLLQTQKKATVTITMTTAMTSRVDPVTIPAIKIISDSVGVVNSVDVLYSTLLRCNMSLAELAKTLVSKT